jgi:hypothetical protein
MRNWEVDLRLLLEQNDHPLHRNKSPLRDNVLKRLFLV